MFENICVGIMVTIVVVVGIWSWWIDNHGTTPDIKNIENNTIMKL